MGDSVLERSVGYGESKMTFEPFGRKKELIACTRS